MSVRQICIGSMILATAVVATAQVEWTTYEGNPVIGTPAAGDWDSKGHWVEGLVVVDEVYHLFFSGTEVQPLVAHAIGHATSVDGVEWVMDPGNPVLTPEPEGSWDVTSLMTAAVLHDGEQFHMWYGGVDASSGKMGYATSPDGTVWSRHPDNPVLAGEAGSFDAGFLLPNDVVERDGVYHLWYGASPIPLPAIAQGGSLGYATSPDGVTWSRHPDPVLEPATGWESHSIFGAGVLFDGSIYHMWYPGYAGTTHVTGIAIGYATSSDGIAWTRDPGNPIEALGDGVSQPMVVLTPAIGAWEMIYTHDFPHYTVLRATSPYEFEEETWRWILPAAGFGQGAAGAFYVTDIDVSNPSGETVQYRFAWLPRGVANETWTWSEWFVLGEGRSARYENVLVEVFDLEPGSYGAVGLEASSPDLLAMGRIFSRPEAKVAGTFGQAIPAVPVEHFQTAGTTRRLLFGTQNADVRYNVGCQSAASESVDVTLALVRADGTPLDQITLTLQPWGNAQLNRVFADFAPVTGRVDVWTDAAEGGVYCYGSMLDNQTSDPTTIPPL